MPPQGPPPGWPPGGPPYSSPPPRKRIALWKILVPVLALVLVAGIAVGGFLYGTGRLGFGPLSAADKDAAELIASEAEGLEWADDEQRECAADDLLHDRRSGDLEAAGVIERDGGDWTYTGTWPATDATAYVEAVLDCSDDWPSQVGGAWSLDDTDCLEDLDQGTFAEFLAADALTLDEPDDADDAVSETVDGLDECYVSDPAAPKGSATPGYRSVTFELAAPEVENAAVELLVGANGKDPKPFAKKSIKVDTGMGGREGCVVAEAVATYGWGTSRTAEKKICGTSEPARIYWRKLPACHDQADAPCNSWELRYEGWKGLASVTARLSQNGGDCQSVTGECAYTTTAPPSGRGVIVTWSAYPGWSETFTAEVGELSATLPN